MRGLTREEERLIRYLIGLSPGYEHLLEQLPGARVQTMDDGGMGSVQFAGDDARIPGGFISEYEFTDRDGVLGIASVVIDSEGNLYELDMWKGDNSPLQDFPHPLSGGRNLRP